MISYKTIHPCGPHDVEMWISFLLDPKRYNSKRECSKRFQILEKTMNKMSSGISRFYENFLFAEITLDMICA